MQTNENIESSLVSALGNDNLELTSEIGELTLDHFLDDEFLKEIPTFSILYKGLKTVNGIREAIFAMKIYKFLKDFKAVKETDTNSLIHKINQSTKEKIRVGQTLIMIIEKLDDLEKTKIVANLFLAYLKGYLTLQEFTHLCSISQNLYIEHLKELCFIKDMRKLKRDVESYLASAGLLTPFIMDYKSLYSEKVIIENNDYILLYNITPMGQKMRKYAFEKQTSS